MQANKLTIATTILLSSGNKIPMIGYGTYQLKGNDCVLGTKAAINSGYTHIDTASIYQNEAEIKRALEQVGISREKLYITSKISPGQQGKKQSREAVETIISKLNCKYLDLILIHWPGSSKYKAEDPKNKQLRLQTWNSFIQLQKEGKVKDIGVSNFLKHHLEHLFKNTNVKPTVNQFEIHPLLWEGATIEFCQKQNIAIQAYSPLARQDDKLFKNKTMVEIAKKYEKSIAQISLRWCLQHGFIILPKSKTEERIKENINIYDFEIDQEDMKKIDLLRKENVRTCWDPNNVKH